MTTEEILAKATPRPWDSTTHGAITDSTPERVRLFIPHNETTVQADAANSELIVLAVNSYEEREALIRQLVEALGNMECWECGHVLGRHLDQYGCEYERGDIEGNEGEPARAAGPCGCKCSEDISHAERNAVAALAAAKQAVQP